jgi:hypothetical protein
VVVVSVAAVEASVEGVAVALAPELMDPDAPVLPAVLGVLAALPAVLPAEEPCAAAPEPAGVPVVPIGVFWVLRWPAAAGSVEVVGGVVVCAKARLTVAAAMAAARILRVDMEDLLYVGWFVTGLDASTSQHK